MASPKDPTGAAKPHSFQVTEAVKAKENDEIIDKKQHESRLAELHHLILRVEDGTVEADLAELRSLRAMMKEMLKQAHPDAKRQGDRRDSLVVTSAQWDGFLDRYMKCVDLMDQIPKKTRAESSGDESDGVDGGERSDESDSEERKVEEKEEDPGPCEDRDCLLFETFPVGIFNTAPKRMQEALLGRIEGGGVTFKLGKGRATASSVRAAHKLLMREFPQVRLSLL